MQLSCDRYTDELFPLHQATDQRSYRIEGYAYSGGGRPITRVEITFDDGQHWHLCETRHPFEPNAAGRQWAWARFTYDASLVHLLCCTEFAVRAWDCSNNTQPHRWTWNVMGMGNNAWFRVRVSPVPDPNTGGISLRFEHPTVPGPSAGGWMPPPSTVSSEQQGAATSVAPTATVTVITQNGAEEAGRVPAVPKLVANPAVSPPPPSVVGSTVHGSNVYQQMMRKKAAEKMQHTEQRLFTLTQVEQHQTEADTWIIVRGRVYDVTAYLNDHPGGKAAILMNAGQDCTEDFEAIHSEKAWKLLEDFCIGKVVPAETALADTPHLAYTDSSTDLLRQQLAKDANPLKAFIASARDEKIAGSERALDPKRWCSFSLLSREYITADTLRLRFALPDPEQSLGLPTGNHLLVRAQMNDKIVIRAYTPTSLGHTLGYFELVIKVYRAGTHPKFPDGGKMSQYLDGLCIGDSVEVKGPLGHFTYLGNGSYLLHGRPGKARQFVFLCAGNGHYTSVSGNEGDSESSRGAQESADAARHRRTLSHLCESHQSRHSPLRRTGVLETK
ncbi:hypothetical protein F1559_003206 [Cyanidiococcus yangmingshanensis]|uniref:Uncharacterized protein n=1 Tax=Cyanidiococcus yangmingshanensis TaxID=2690220 RepID=A0A7J7IE29_9RHOD|nr:hypothetical protein F1559_003206 [Cyanidiococcus yangmingshanensis]